MNMSRLFARTVLLLCLLFALFSPQQENALAAPVIDSNSFGSISATNSIKDLSSCATITFGAPPVNGSISTVEEGCYTFSGTVGDRIRVSAVKTSGTLSPFRTIFNPNGTILCSSITNPLDCTLTTTGTHTISITDFSGTGNGTYALYSQRLNDPVGCTALSFGNPPLSGSIGVAGEEDCYTFSGTAGDRIRVSAVKTSGTLSPFRTVFNPDGTILCSAVTNPLDCTLTTTGTHTISIKDFSGTGIGAYGFYAQRLNNPVGCTPLSFGNPTLSDSINLAAEEDCFTFSGVTGDRIRVSAVKISGTLSVFRTIFNPDGSILCSSITNPLDCTLTTTGTHTISIMDFSGTGIGAYGLYAQRLNNPVGCTVLLHGNPPLSGSISVAGEEDCYTFGGTTGDRVRVSAVKTSGALTPMRQILNPDGSVLCGSITNPVDCTLITSGMHTVLIYDFSGSNIGSYNISLLCLTSSCNAWYGGVVVMSDRNVVAVGRPHIGAQVMTYDGFASGSLNAYVPMLFKDAFGGSYDSALYVQNVDPSNIANITIRFYDSNDVQTYSMPDTLPPLASKGYWLPSISALGSSWVGGVKVESNRNIVAVGRPHVGAEVMTYNGFASGSLDAYVPMLFKDAFGGSYDSALYIQNVDPGNTANVTIRFYDSSGNETYSMPDIIAPLASKGYWLPSIAGLGSSWVGGVKVESNRNIVAVGRPHIGSQVLTYNGFSSGSLNAYVPMLFKDAFGGSYDAALYVQNVDPANTANITIHFYDSNGNETYSMTDSVSSLASKGYWLPAITPLGTSWVGGVKVESDRDIVAVGRPHVGAQVMAYNGFASGSTNAYVPMLFKDAFGGSYDSALYIQNLDASNDADVTIKFYDVDGNLSCTLNDTISALASKGWWLPSLKCSP